MRMRIAALFAYLGLVAHVQAGTVIQNTTKDLESGKQTDDETIYVQNGMARIDNLDERGHVRRLTLFRDGALWEVDVANRTYTKIDKATMQQGMQQMNQMMKERMANMTPEQRAAMEKLMKGMQGQGPAAQPTEPAVQLRDAGKTEHVAQFSCHLWDSLRNNKLTGQLCTVPESEFPGGDEIMAAMRQVGAIMQDMTAASPMARVGQRWADFLKTNGYPVLHREFSSAGKPYREVALKSVTREALPAEKFEIPKGFTEKNPFANAGGKD